MLIYFLKQSECIIFSEMQLHFYFEMSTFWWNELDKYSFFSANVTFFGWDVKFLSTFFNQNLRFPGFFLFFWFKTS